MTDDGVVRGSCLCGGVTWEGRRPFHSMSHCYCSMCRKSHGTAFGTYVATAAEGYRLQGEALIAQYQSSPDAVRRFCSRCGSIVPGPASGPVAWMPAGNLSGDPGTRPEVHTFVASKVAWYEIPDALPRFDAYPPGYDLPSIDRPAPAATEAGWVPGGCLCGEVAFELHRGSWTLMQCHCSRCRRGRSAAHGTNLFVDAASFRWLRGKSELRAYKVPEAERFTQVFCSHCGSKLPREAGERVVVPAGALDGDPGIAERKHIHTGSKAAWFEIADSWPQFETMPARV